MAELAQILFTEATTGTQKARFAFMMRKWRSMLLNESTDAMSLSEKKKWVNKWLADFEKIFTDNEIKINILAGFTGYLSAGGVGGEELFLNLYDSTVKALSSKDVTWARLQRNSLATRIKKKGIKELLDEWDEFLIEARGLGLTRGEITKNFMNTIAKSETSLIDSAGRLWKPDNYARMYSNTRDSVFRDEIFQDQTIELGQDVVQVSDHGTSTPICKLYEGKVYSLTGATEGLPILPQRPGFHPGCKHVLVRRPGLSNKEAKKINFFKDKDIKKESANFTEGQKKSIKRQTKWNLENRPPKGLDNA